ncbi:MAG: alpha/beta hydrolase [Hirschia sp.]|nr:alpha/beta hydrolase [Hirschia sp.]MBF20076.1 alpha/beta hydrolase [Hirschia sp.]|tara:strand:+ start:343 stop:1005 length:663 start_codon:yes stop_codon:yes gene_type:complete
MPEIIIPGPTGRIEARYEEGTEPGAPVALILHHHPRAGGTMQDPVVITLYEMFAARGFATLRYNFRGVGRSQGQFDSGPGELSDAAYVLDYLENMNEGSRQCWVAGYSFGAFICLQLLMRRPEISGFIAVSPPANHYDLSFLAPCPASGIIISGDRDAVVGPSDIERSLAKVRVQKGEVIERSTVEGANHFYQDRLDKMEALASEYLDRRYAEVEAAKSE